jgi:S-adenosylmethionine:tRNA ribosyltransferase-isomerase
MKTSDFDYPLPSDLIAKQPLSPRDASRMLVLERATRTIHHAKFLDLCHWLRAGDLVVLNDTKVMPARLFAVRERPDARGRMTRSRIEVLLLDERAPALWESLVRPGQKVHLGDRIIFGDGEFVAVVEDRTDFGGRVLRFENARAPLALMEKHGAPPLPCYILRARSTKQPQQQDKEIYQTVFARQLGAAAAPTAGLHFTDAAFEKLKSAGVGVAYITLHVGLGTFRPVKVKNIEDHKMHRERFTIPAETLRAIKETKARGGRVVAVGTTVVRTLEGSAKRAEGGSLKPEVEDSDNSGLSSQVSSLSGTTDIFIYPPFEFKVVDALLTNFHLPKSTLLMLVSAFASPNKLDGRDLVLRAYAEAVKEQYRFYSYGDCMLVV